MSDAPARPHNIGVIAMLFRFCLVFSIIFVLIISASRAFLGAGQAPSPASDASPDSAAVYAKSVKPLLEKYCYECHGNGKHKADVALDSYKTPDDVVKGKKKWESLIQAVRMSEMPPEGKPQPTLEERETITAWVEKVIYHFDPKNPDPGRVTIRRLNKTEYSNTIRDLVGIDFNAAADFPADDQGYGFDNIGDVLSLPPVLMEKYLAAATRIVDEAIVTEAIPSKTQRIPANLMEIGFNAEGDRGDGWVQLQTLEEDQAAIDLTLPQGEYKVRFLSFANKGKGSKLSLMIDGAIFTEFQITAAETKPAVYEAEISWPGGRHKIGLSNRRTRSPINGSTTLENGRLGKRVSTPSFVKYFEVEGPIHADNRRVRGADLGASGDTTKNADGSRTLKKEGEATMPLSIAKDGDYILRVQAYALQSGSEPAKMEFRINGKAVHITDVTALGNYIPIAGNRVFSKELLLPVPEVYQVKLPLKEGAKSFSAALLNYAADPKNTNPNLRERVLTIDHMEVVNLAEGQHLAPMPAAMKNYFSKSPTPETKHEIARDILGQFARRAWRRPVQPSELDKLVKLFDLADKEGGSFETSIKLPLKATLVSPYFLFRGELQPEPDNPNSVHPVNEFSLASRLSYFLWSSMPDDELLDLAEKGELRKNQAAQMKRMLASPKSQALVENFAGQWLQTRNLKFITPDKKLFPDFDEALRRAMAKESELFFGSIFHEDRSLLDFLTADYTFVNERLAQHYGMEGVSGEGFQKVSLKGTHRAGILTQAGVLALTSNPTRTNLVKRGKWILENMLNTPPPPPPANVPPLEEDGKELTGTLRQQMGQHRANPACANCHARLDPIGFGFENFDAVGVWRDKEADVAVDSSGQLVSGEKFAGATELAAILANSKRKEFLRCMAEKMLTYALGRGLEYYDRPAVEKIVRSLEENQFRMSVLIEETVNSLPFQQRRGEEGQAATN